MSLACVLSLAIFWVLLQSWELCLCHVILIKTFLNPEGHQNRISGSKVTAILVKGWILPIGGASSVDGLRSTGLSRLVFNIH